MIQNKISLGKELQKQLLSAMEDQERQYRFNLESRLVEPGAPDPKQGLLPLPRWTSVDGFRMISSFIQTLPNPLLRAELQEVLDQGHGVFRNFKRILRNQNLAYRNWQRYRQRTMEAFLREWVGTWEKYLEILPLKEEPEDLDDLVMSEFTIRLESDVHPPEEALEGLFSSDLIWFPPLDKSIRGTHLIVRTMEGDSVGWIWACDAPTQAVAQILIWYVIPSFRGLGLGRTLLHQMEAELLRQGITSIIVPDYGSKAGIDRQLTHQGYLQHSKVYLKNLE